MLKRIRTVCLALGLASVMVQQQAIAQETVPAGELVLAGMPMLCGAIPTTIQPMADIAMAAPGIIILNPALFKLPAPLQHFVYAHECGHHLLGDDESTADCWAIKTGRDQGWFPPQAFDMLIKAFAFTDASDTSGDWTHAPGPLRIQNLYACYTS